MMDFTTILSAPHVPLRELLVRLEKGLVESGFRHDFSVLRAAYDAERKVFDETDPDEEVPVRTGYAELAREVALWEGCSCEFWNGTFSLYVLIGRMERGAYINVWIDIALRTLERLLENREERAFLGALATICSAVDAHGGYGGPELPFHPLAPDRARTAFIDMPGYPGEASMLGLLPASELTEAQLRERYGSTFTYHLSTQGYWVLTQDLAGLLLPPRLRPT